MPTLDWIGKAAVVNHHRAGNSRGSRRWFSPNVIPASIRRQFTESGEPWTTGHQVAGTKQSLATGGPLIGAIPNGAAVYLLFDGERTRVARNGASTLSADTLEALAPFPGPRVVYADACTLRKSALARERIVFKQIPYQIVQQ